MIDKKINKSFIGLSLVSSLALADTYNLGQINVQAQALNDINMIEQNKKKLYSS